MRLVWYRGKWAVTGTTNGKQWRRSLGTEDRLVAERRLADVRFETPGELVEDAMRLYLDEKRDRSSYGSMETSWRALKQFFGHHRPDQVSRTMCRDYAKSRREGGVSSGTIIKDLGVLKAALKFAGKPPKSFWMPSAPPPKDRYITREEVGRLADAALLPHVRLFMVLAWCTAGRHSALLQLSWARVDMPNRTIRLAETSGRDSRDGKGRATVRINDWLLLELQRAYDRRTCDYVIEWGGKPLRSIKRGFAEAARRAGLEDVTPHVLRHSAAVAMAGAGVPMEKISQYLGHTSTKVTERVYARFTPDHLKDAAEALE